MVWVADITYLRSGEGWLYLAAVQDSYSRAIVGWSMATHMRAQLAVDALRMALARRRPGPGLIHTQTRARRADVSLAFGRAASQAGIAVSMFEYIEAFYNRQRRHSTLGMVSPAEYEQTKTMEKSIKIKQPTT